MINLYDSSIVDILPSNLVSDEVKAVAQAIQKANQKALDFAKNICIYTNIDKLDATILDAMAIDLATQYYQEDLDIEKKKKLVHNTLQWYCKAGTTAAVEELIKTVFGSGEVTEWFEYGGEPFHFKILTSNASVTEADIAKFENIIDNVKRKSAVLDAIEIVITVTMNVFTGMVLHTGDILTFVQEG